MFCSKCGSPVQEGHKFCMQCGAPVQQPAQSVQQPVQRVQKPVQPAAQKVTEATPVQMPEQNLQQPAQKQKKSKKGKKAKLSTVILIVVAVLLVILIALLAIKFLVLDRSKESDSDSVWSGVTDVSEAGTQAVAGEDSATLLKQKLDEVIASKGNLMNVERDLCVATCVQDVEGVTGAVICDVSGDGVEDLVISYAEAYCVYADVYTVEGGSVVQKGDYLLGTGYFANETSNEALGGVYLKETPDGWNLIADSWVLANLFADGVGHEVKAVSCKDHNYEVIADFSLAGSDLQEDEFHQEQAVAEEIGIERLGDPFSGPFFKSDSDVTAICVFDNKVDPAAGAAPYELEAGEQFGTFYVSAMTDDNYQPDSEALSKLLKDYQSYREIYEERVETLRIENSEYILPQSAERKLTEEDLADIKDDKWMLKVARNEIFARYGRMFQDEKLQEYFESKDWYEPLYTPEEFDESMVSDLEMNNAKFIKGYEDKAK